MIYIYEDHKLSLFPFATVKWPEFCWGNSSDDFGVGDRRIIIRVRQGFAYVEFAKAQAPSEPRSLPVGIGFHHKGGKSLRLVVFETTFIGC